MRWCVKNGRLIIFFGSIVVPTILFLFGLDLDLPIWFYLLFAFSMFVVCFGTVNLSVAHLIKKSVNIINEQCDPYPLLKEAEDQLTYNRFKMYKHILLINQSVALAYMGEYQKVRDILEAINIDKYVGTMDSTKVAYYNNLSDIYLRFGEIGKADIWHEKSKQMLEDIKQDKYKSRIFIAIQNCAAEIAYEKKEYDKAYELLNSYKDENLLDSVNKALLLAKIYIEKGEIEQAKQKLQYVIDNGNKIIHVQIAKKLIEECFNT